MPLRITTLGCLKQEAREGEGFFILLNHNLRSSKWIVIANDLCAGKIKP